MVRTYSQNDQITAVVEVTANHMGYFEFRICNVDRLSSGEANQECLNENVLKDRFGRVRIPVVPGVTGRIPVVLNLPRGLSCNHCVLQVNLIISNFQISIQVFGFHFIQILVEI